MVMVGVVRFGVSATGDSLTSALHFGGLAAIGVALAAAGYTTVEKAPVWLRGVVAVAASLLGLMTWIMVDPAITKAYSAAVSHIVVAVAAIVAGLWGRRRAAMAPEPEPRGTRRAEPPVRGRRAAR